MHSLIAQMGYIVIATPDLEAAAADLVDILGLRISGRLDDRIYFQAIHDLARSLLCIATIAASARLGSRRQT
jgi:hypothetical protein